MSKGQCVEPEVSVIVPVFNAEWSLRPCIESILALRFPRERFEVICVDNGSSDGSARILREFQPFIRVISEARRGAAAARNAGLRSARGQWVAFTDSDCVVTPDWLREILAPVQTGKWDAAGGRFLAREGAGAVERFGELIHDHRFAIEQSRPPYLMTGNLAARLDRLRSVGGFDERWLRSQDSELAFRLVASECRFAYAPRAIVYHYNRDSLGKLFREGFLHGYYGSHLRRIYADLIASYKERNPPSAVSPAGEGQPAATLLKPWQIRLFWGVFRLGKRAGQKAGQWYPPKTLRTLPAGVER